jgi:hypothetical protein
MALNIVVDWQEYKTEINGEEISMQLLPLKTDAFLILSPFLSEAADITKMVEAQKASISFLHEYVRDIKGIVFNGREPTGEDIATQGALFQLACKILPRLVDITVMTKADEGNSEGPSDTPTSESPSEQQ